MHKALVCEIGFLFFLYTKFRI